MTVAKEDIGVAADAMRTSLKVPLRRVLRAIEVLAWAGFFAFATVFLALRYWLLPNVEQYRGDIVASISRAIDLPVKIGALATDWQGLRFYDLIWPAFMSVLSSTARNRSTAKKPMPHRPTTPAKASTTPTMA